jgi:hypothetical protein
MRRSLERKTAKPRRRADTGRSLDWDGMSYTDHHEALHSLVRKTIQSSVNLSIAKRELLLPGLESMKRKTAKPGRRLSITGERGWQDECRLLGLSAELVRKWRQLSASETDILELLGEERERRKPGTKSQAALAMMLAVRIAKATIKHKDAEAANLAQEILERFDK